MSHSSLWLLSPQSSVRRVCFLLLADARYQAAGAVTTLAAVLTLGAERPGGAPRGAGAAAVGCADAALNALLGLELALALLVKGCVAHPGSLMRTWAGWAQALAFAGGLAGTLGPPRALRALRTLRLFPLLRLARAHRTARSRSRAPALPLALSALERAAPQLRRLAALGAFATFLFAVTAAQLFAGAARRCGDGPGVPASAGACAGVSVGASGSALALRTASPVLNFETVPSAALTLFALGTWDTWSTVVRPFAVAQPASLLLFLTWMLLFGLGLRSLVAGAVLDAHSRLSRALAGRVAGDEATHRNWAVAMRLQRQQAARATAAAHDGASHQQASPSMRALRAMLAHPSFDAFIAICTLVTCLLAAAGGGGQAALGQEIVFTTIFSAEQLALLLARGPGAYRRHGWQLWDGCVTACAVARLAGAPVSFYPLALRMLRLERVTRLLPRARALGVLYDTACAAVPGCAAAAALLLLLLVVFSIFGMVLFGGRVPPPPLASSANAGATSDFSSFGAALLTMIRLLTLDGWCSTLTQLMRCEGVSYPLVGGPAYAERCNPSPAPTIFLIAWTLLATWTLLPLFAATLLDAHRQVADASGAAASLAESLRRYDLLQRAVMRFMAPVRKRRAREGHWAALDAAGGGNGKLAFFDGAATIRTD